MVKLILNLEDHIIIYILILTILLPEFKNLYKNIDIQMEQ